MARRRAQSLTSRAVALGWAPRFQILNKRLILTITARFVSAGKRRGQRVPLFVEHHEQLAAGPILPAQAHVGGHRVAAGVVLQQRAHEHQRRHRVGDARADQMGRERALRQIHPVHREAGLDRQLRREVHAAPAEAEAVLWPL